MLKLDNIEIILVNPKYPENIGSVCRAIKTMGMQALSVVSPVKPDIERMKTLAVHAFDIVEKIKYFDTLPEATKGASLIAGISRRRGKKRKYFTLFPEDLAVKITENSAQQIALVFGNEESGLTDTELACCHLLVQIPSSPAFPSLNLSHAVQIISYVIFRACTQAAFHGFTPITETRLSEVISVIIQSLKKIGFFTLGDCTDLGIFFTDIFARAGLSGKEAKRIEILFKKISGMITNKNRIY